MATIGIDLTPIQGPHRLRGVGSTVINMIRHLSAADQKDHRFVLYLHEENQQDALDLIHADRLLNYEVRHVTPLPPIPPSIKTKAGLLYLPKRIRNMLIDRQLGDKRIVDVSDLDIFLQFEQDVIPPKGVQSVIVAYDLIPYVLESDYLWNYRTARSHHHYSRRGALKAQFKRNMYMAKIKSAMKSADKILAISNHTKNDFVQYLGLPKEKIVVAHLGVSGHTLTAQQKPLSVVRHTQSSWGDVITQAPLPDTPFLLFVGGADPRRKIADLVHAFNLLRAQGHNIHLVLAGDTMLGPNSVPNSETRKALLSSSYLDDIYMLGFVEESTREWLYKNTLAFVYPSTYEGFGLPILEAMQYGSPVITYKNSSITEIGSNHVLYADDFLGIAQFASDLLNSQDTSNMREQRIAYAKKFSWSKFAKDTLTVVTSIKN